MNKRRGYRDGGIDQRGEKSWRLRYRVNGRRFTKTVHGTKSEAQKALRDLLHAGDTGEHVAPDKMTLGQWIDHWIAAGAPGRSQKRAGRRTVERYSELMRCHVVPVLGTRRLSNSERPKLTTYMLAFPRSSNRGRPIMCMSS